MLTKTLALTGRGLRRDNRMISNHLLRLGVVLVVFLMVFGAHISSLAVGAPGLGFFSSITYTTLVFATLAGATFFATAITEEKEEQTLGLLTLANIRPLALIVGKFLPRLLNALLILTVVLPFALLAITLGGVMWNQVWAAYWSLFAHVVFMGSIGLFFSVLCRTSSGAITWSILAMLLYFVGLPIAAGLLGKLAPYTAGSAAANRLIEGVETLASASAFLHMSEILQTGFDGGAFGVQVIANLGMSALLLFVSWALFGPFNRAAEGSAQALPMFDRALRLKRGSRRPWRHPIVWKDFHYTAGGWAWLLLRGLGYIGIGILAAIVSNDFQLDWELRRAIGSVLVISMMLIAVPIEMTVLAARLFRAEIKNGTWPTLVGLPRSIGAIAAAKLGGGLIGVAPAFLVALAGVLIAPDAIASGLFASNGAIEGVLMYLSYSALFLMFLHLTTLYSIIFNSWVGVLLAVVTVWFASCFTGPLFLLPFLIISSLTGMASEWLGLMVGIVIYSVAFLGICFGLEVLIVQQLRSAAAR
jgi:ABC-type transport system involved in multi-copper enzyme maturation permease subunit